MRRKIKKTVWAKDGLTQNYCDLVSKFSFASKCIIAKNNALWGVIYDTSQ